MSATAAQITANRENSTHSTGPRTPEGKSKSARNHLQLGLFTAEAYVLPAEQPQYDAIAQSLWTELQPQGTLEETHTLEIIRAAWRLQRCGKIEAQLADAALEGTLDDDALDRKQRTVDRARSESNNTIRRATAELRRLQTNREIAAALPEPAEPAAPLAERKQVIAALLDDAKTEKTVRHLQGIDDLAGLLEFTDNQRARTAA